MLGTKESALQLGKTLLSYRRRYFIKYKKLCNIKNDSVLKKSSVFYSTKHYQMRYLE